MAIPWQYLPEHSGGIVRELVLVTGANKGLGKETARQLAHRGMAVLLGSRDLDRGRRAAEELAGAVGPAGGPVLPIQLDVTDPDSVKAAAEHVHTTHGRLDVLVNNAGVFAGARAADTTVTELRDQFEVNVFGVVTVTHAFLPLLRRSAAPRIVNLSSTTASLTLTADGVEIPGDTSTRLAYASSKAALNMLTVQYAKAFRADPALAHILVNAAVPGFTATDMNDHRGIRPVRAGARVIVDLAVLPADGPTGGLFDDRGPVPW
jgi:NAD(P)-dependent dehydrogenase (short-subunit alcohol dehydrogenase family)